MNENRRGGTAMPRGARPWDDWTPGVLSKRQVKRLVDEDFISVAEPAESLGVSSLDLTLSSEAYHLPEGAIKPSGARYFRDVRPFGQALPPMNDSGQTLEPRQTYLVKLRERLPNLQGSGIHGQATAKSSVGRVDVLARLIVDGMNCYEAFSPEVQGSGDLYLEITPLTFPIVVKPGIALSQLRLFYGSPEGCRISGTEAYKTFLKGAAEPDGTLSVDLSPTAIRNHEAIAFRAVEAADYPPIRLWMNDELPDPCRYWEIVKAHSSKRLSLKKGSFYILKSKELLALPQGVAVYCRAIDETFGEMRIHYAGFAHPWFGRKRPDGRVGTPLIFEVRGHDVNVSLQDGETMARLLFYRMSEDAAEEDAGTSYEGQDLQLSKYFAPWPDQLEVGESGTVSTR